MEHFETMPQQAFALPVGFEKNLYSLLGRLKKRAPGLQLEWFTGSSDHVFFGWEADKQTVPTSYVLGQKLLTTTHTPYHAYVVTRGDLSCAAVVTYDMESARKDHVAGPVSGIEVSDPSRILQVALHDSVEKNQNTVSLAGPDLILTPASYDTLALGLAVRRHFQSFIQPK